MLHLSIIRQHFDAGFSSVLSLIEELEQQIESLTPAHQSSSHIQHLEQTIAHQKSEISRLSKTVENKSKEIFKLHQTHHHLQDKLQIRLSKANQLNRAGFANAQIAAENIRLFSLDGGRSRVLSGALVFIVGAKARTSFAYCS
ncbi:MAG TPA: hypothetical protein VGB68_02290 [Pyrinomonadaceae bacterium]